MPHAARVSSAFLLVLAGCEAWPRWAHLPEDAATLPGDVHPRASVAVTWTEVLGGDEDQPPGTPLGPLSPGEGRVLDGVADGLGWSDTRTPQPLLGPACGSTGDRAPVAGDYTGDVDVHEVTLPEAGRLCLRAVAGTAEDGFDLLLFPLDGCGVPGEPMLDPATGAIGGAGFLGPVLDWGVDVEPGRYAVLIAGFHPVDPDAVRAWTLGISVVDDGLCPLLPGEEVP